MTTTTTNPPVFTGDGRRLIDPVALRDIAAMYPGNIKYDTLREYSRTGVLPTPAKRINNVTKDGSVPVWDISDIRDWATARGWTEAT